MDDDIAALVNDLTHAPQEAMKNIRSAVQYTATEIKKDWRQGADRTGLSGYAASIDYDIRFSTEGIEAEIGPNLGRKQGALGIVEDEHGAVHSTPQHAGRDALEANQPDFERGLAIAIWDAVLGRESRMGGAE